ncbi:MAG TPA: hypothetical protein VFW22_14445 [Pseudolabrys sp.]|nr:hypothetical protein [Pseudolabrys sp.]
MRAIAAFIVSSLILAPAGAQDLLKPGGTISGKVRFFRHQHLSGAWFDVYQMTSDNPRMFAEKDEFCDDKVPPKTFHLNVMGDKANKARLDRLLGKKISIVAERFFCSDTDWHVGDAFVGKWHFAEPPKH